MRKSLLIIIGLFLTLNNSKSYDINDEAFVNYKAGNYSKAVIGFTKLVKDNPENTALELYLANASLKAGAPDKALVIYKKSLNSINDSIKALSSFNSGVALMKLGDYKSAEEYFVNSLKLNHKMLEAKYNLSFCKAKLKNDNEDKNKKEGKPESDTKPSKGKNTPDKENKQISKETAKKMLDLIEALDEKILNSRNRKNANNNITNDKKW